MINGFYTAKSGVEGHQNLLNISANNLANASTTGYKAQRAAFSELIYTNLPSPAEGGGELLAGHGMRLDSLCANLEQGIINQTDNNLDIAILGQGYFCIETQEGERYYTRAGNFQINKIQDKDYLCTAAGDRVLDNNYQPVVIEKNAAGENVTGESNAEENITGVNPKELKFYSPGEAAEGKGGIILALVAFNNPNALQEKGRGLLAANKETGQGEADYSSRLRQGALEYSNVNMVNEMTKMIQAQRGFQFNARILQAADEIEAMANTLRG